MDELTKGTQGHLLSLPDLSKHSCNPILSLGPNGTIPEVFVQLWSFETPTNCPQGGVLGYCDESESTTPELTTFQFLALGPQVSYLISLSFCFPICKMRIIMPTHTAVVKIKLSVATYEKHLG